MTDLHTERLLLRRWRTSDRSPFAALNADPRVMEFMPSVLDPASSDALVDRIEAHFEAHGFGLWAVEAREGFVGFVGLSRPTFEAHFTPCVEVGWRLAAHAWGKGYASEAARAACNEGFTRWSLPEIVSFTSTKNERSWRVMERIGMTRDVAGDFDHPRVAEGHWLRRHCVYRLRR